MTIQHRLDATTQTWRKPDAPRSFLLKFDQTKLHSANPVRRLEYQEKKELMGVQFPNGACILDRNFMNYFPTLTDLCDSFGTIGKYEIEWLDEQESEAVE